MVLLMYAFFLRIRHVYAAVGIPRVPAGGHPDVPPILEDGLGQGRQVHPHSPDG